MVCSLNVLLTDFVATASSKLSAIALWSFLVEVDTTLAGLGRTELLAVIALQAARRLTLHRALMISTLG